MAAPPAWGRRTGRWGRIAGRAGVFGPLVEPPVGRILPLPRGLRRPHRPLHVHKLLAHEPERGVTPPAREVALAAYHVALARRVRYFGPLTPVDLRV